MQACRNCLCVRHCSTFLRPTSSSHNYYTRRKKVWGRLTQREKAAKEKRGQRRVSILRVGCSSGLNKIVALNLADFVCRAMEFLDVFGWLLRLVFCDFEFGIVAAVGIGLLSRQFFFMAFGFGQSYKRLLHGGSMPHRACLVTTIFCGLESWILFTES